MAPLDAVALLVGTVVATEGAAWLVHRFVMHGPGWAWHRSHHEPGPARLERNDLYALAFAAADVVLFAVSGGPRSALWWIAAGVAVYGVLYAWVHDGLVHRRWPAGPAPRRGWLERLVRAHRLHHAVRERDGAVSFGFLWAPPPRTLVRRLRAARAAAAACTTGAAGAAGTAAAPDARRDTAIGLALGAGIVVGWAAVLAATLAGWRWDRFGAATALAAVPVIALQTWLCAGLFIVAHDAIHGSLAPAMPRTGRALGRLALALYAGFRFAPIEAAHHAHHRHPGTDRDPDFDAAHPDRFWPWYVRFVRRYFGIRELATLGVAAAAAVAAGARPLDLAAFWALPAMLSSLQLFRWGTWLPHRHAADPFADAHRARDDPRGRAATLATCFHFGIHHVHHRHPGRPWWRLPAGRPRDEAPPCTAAAPDVSAPPDVASPSDTAAAPDVAGPRTGPHGGRPVRRRRARRAHP